MKRFFIAVALTVACAPAFAQEVVGLQEAQTRRGPYLTNRLFDNIFISVAGGINIYEGENDRYGGKRLAPALDVAVGKWVTPSVGLRLQYSGLKAYGWTNARTMYAVASESADSRVIRKPVPGISYLMSVSVGPVRSETTPITTSSPSRTVC